MRANTTEATALIRECFDSQESYISSKLKNFKKRFNNYDRESDMYEFDLEAGDIICEFITLFNEYEDMEIFYTLFGRFKAHYSEYFIKLDQVLAAEFEDYFKEETSYQQRNQEIDMLFLENPLVNEKYQVFRKMNIQLFEDFFHRIRTFELKYVSRALNQRKESDPQALTLPEPVAHTVLLLHELGIIDHLRKTLIEEQARESKIAKVVATIIKSNPETVRKAIAGINSRGKSSIMTPRTIEKVKLLLSEYGISKSK